MDALSWLVIFSLLLVLVSYFLLHNRRTLLSANKKAIIITGCDSGIGLEAARVFDNLGFTVFAGCLFPSATAELKKVSSDKLVVLDFDVTDADKVNEAVRFVEEYCQKEGLSVWCLINNAGICIGGDVEWQTWEQCEKQVDVNFLGMVRTVKAFLPLIKESEGRIINVSSVNGRWALPKFTIYCATKFAIEGFSDGLRLELLRHNVKVIVVAPGDHAKITNIMKNQSERAKEQWNSFSEPFRDEVGPLFWAVQSNMSAKAGLTSFTHFKQSPVFEDLKLAVMDEKPKTHYTSTSIKYRIIFFVLRNLPTSISDYVLVKIQKSITDLDKEE